MRRALKTKGGEQSRTLHEDFSVCPQNVIILSITLCPDDSLGPASRSLKSLWKARRRCARFKFLGKPYTILTIWIAKGS